MKKCLYKLLQEIPNSTSFAHIEQMGLKSDLYICVKCDGYDNKCNFHFDKYKLKKCNNSNGYFIKK